MLKNAENGFNKGCRSRAAMQAQQSQTRPNAHACAHGSSVTGRHGPSIPLLMQHGPGDASDWYPLTRLFRASVGSCTILHPTAETALQRHMHVTGKACKRASTHPWPTPFQRQQTAATDTKAMVGCTLLCTPHCPPKKPPKWVELQRCRVCSSATTKPANGYCRICNEAMYHSRTAASCIPGQLWQVVTKCACTFSHAKGFHRVKS